MKIIAKLKEVFQSLGRKHYKISKIGYNVDFVEHEFNNALFLSQGEKKKIKGTLFHHLSIHISGIRRIDAITYIINVILQFGLIIIGNLNLTQDSIYFNSNHWGKIVIWYMIIIMYFSIIIFTYYYNYSYFLGEKFNNKTDVLTPLLFLINVFSCFIATGKIFFIYRYHVNSIALLILLYFLLNISLLFILLTLEAFCSQIIRTWLYPQISSTVFILFYSLFYLDELKNYPLDSRVKKYTIIYLESAAKSLKESIYHSNETTNLAFNSWLNEYAEKVANTIREKKKGVIIDNKAISEAQKYLSKVLFYYLTGQWGKIANSKNINVAQEKGSKNIVLQILKNLAIGIIPAISIFIFNYFIKLPEEIQGYIFWGGFIWLLINLLQIIDPTIGEKVKATKDIMGIL